MFSYGLQLLVWNVLLRYLCCGQSWYWRDVFRLAWHDTLGLGCVSFIIVVFGVVVWWLTAFIPGGNLTTLSKTFCELKWKILPPLLCLFFLSLSFFSPSHFHFFSVGRIPQQFSIERVAGSPSLKWTFAHFLHRALPIFLQPGHSQEKEKEKAFA